MDTNPVLIFSLNNEIIFNEIIIKFNIIDKIPFFLFINLGLNKSYKSEDGNLNRVIILSIIESTIDGIL